MSVYSFEISPGTATRLLTAAGVKGLVVNRPTNLLRLTQVARKVLASQPAEGDRVVAKLYDMAADLELWMAANGHRAREFRLPDQMNTAAAATFAASAFKASQEGTGERGFYVGWAKDLLDKLLAHADATDPFEAASWASESFWQLARYEPQRLGKLFTSIERGRVGDVLDALLDYQAPAPDKTDEWICEVEGCDAC